jgi:SNF2 family DNA or RNA helicase
LLIVLFCSAACGINLTAASHIFLLEPCLNPAVEAQAIGRAHRMGQTRSVVVKRLYVKVRLQDLA